MLNNLVHVVCPAALFAPLEIVIITLPLLHEPSIALIFSNAYNRFSIIVYMCMQSGRQMTSTHLMDGFDILPSITIACLGRDVAPFD